MDRFWEELARTLERGPVLERSQELVAAFLEGLKRNSMTQLRSQKDVDALIKELDGLNFNQQFGLPDLRLKPVKNRPSGPRRKGRLINFPSEARACNAWSRVMALTAAAPRAR